MMITSLYTDYISSRYLYCYFHILVSNELLITQPIVLWLWVCKTAS